MQSPLSQLMDLVRLYSKPWEKKSTVLKKLQDDCQMLVLFAYDATLMFCNLVIF